MKCTSPVTLYTGLVGCGQCNNCRINKQREWTCRLMLESYFHEESVFVTLTYSDDHVPRSVDHHLDLQPSDMTKFIKRLRHNMTKLKHFTVGEYGDLTHRPHYHSMLFGVDTSSIEHKIDLAWTQQPEGWPEDILTFKTTDKTHIGFTDVGLFSPERAAYIANYTVKRLGVDHKDLGDRHPEYATMSTNPGIALSDPVIKYLADIMLGKSGSDYIKTTGDVFQCIRIEGSILPLAETLRKKLRTYLGIPQTRPERLQFFDQVGKGREPIPLNYEFEEKWWEDRKHHKHDIVNKETIRGRYEQKKAGITELPEVSRRSEHKARKKARRSSQTQKL